MTFNLKTREDEREGRKLKCLLGIFESPSKLLASLYDSNSSRCARGFRHERCLS
jgi:hypothetical protein